MQAVVLDDQARQALAERCGAGAVRATAILEPVR
jgi:hypothetical protein